MGIKVRNMMKSKRARIGVLSLVLSLIVAISITYAAFMGAGYQRGVVSTTPVGVRFSSDYLEIREAGSAIKEYKVSLPIDKEGDKNPIFYLDIMNVAKKDPFNPSEYDITYDLQIKIKHNQEGQTLSGIFKINDDKFDMDTSDIKEINHTIQKETLKSGKVNTNEYKIEMPYDQVGNVEMTIEAIPDDGSKNVLGNITLARKLTFITYIPGQSSNFLWQGEVIEGEKSKESSAINYKLYGSGKGTVTLSWNNEMFEIDPFFLKKLKEKQTNANITENDEESSIIINVDSTDIGYYQIQFYRMSTIEADEDLEGIFTIHSEEAESTDS